VIRPPLLGASVSGSSAWILWQVSRDALRVRIGQLERDPYVDSRAVRDLRATAAGLEEAARQYRLLVDSSRSLTDSAERFGGGVSADLQNPFRWGVAEVAASLNCSTRWVRTLCRTGQLAATKQHGREWRVDPSSVEDYMQREAA
jgi:excisionase family DNA binding protein